MKQRNLQLVFGRRRLLLISFFFELLLLVHHTDTASAAAASASSSSSSLSSGKPAVAEAAPFSPRNVQRWIQARCSSSEGNDDSTASGSSNSAIWVYDGALYDPLDGQEIATVQGLELVRQLSESDYHRQHNGDGNSSSTLVRQQNRTRRLGDLKAKDIQGGDYSTTVLSRRLFCYQSPQSQTPRLLDEALPNHRRRQRQRKQRRQSRSAIAPQQALALYDSAITYTSRNNGRELVLHTEFPNGQCLWGIASSPSTPVTSTSSNKDNDDNNVIKNSMSSMDFVVFCRPNVHQSVPPPPQQQENDSDQTGMGTSTPPRLQLIQFGGGGTKSSASQASATKFGVRETYSYQMMPSAQSMSSTRRRRRHNQFLHTILSSFGRRPGHDAAADDDNSDNNTSSWACHVKYSRYGEGPPWYGRGGGATRYCVLELRGRKVRSLADAPSLVAGIAGRHVPGFLSVHGGTSPIVTDDAAQRAVRWFRKGNLHYVSDETTNDVWQQRQQHHGGLLRHVFEKIKAASTIEQ